MTPKKLAVVSAVTVLTVGSFMAKRYVEPYETVDKVVDGDTIILARQHQAIRLYGIDAPELGNCYGIKSRDYLGQLLIHRKVQIKEPVVDKFGRIVALIYVEGNLINESMIKNGFASYRSEPGSGQAIMRSAGDYARTHQIGIYSKACTDTSPPDPSCAIKGNHDLDREQNLYLTPTCPYYDAVVIRRFEGDAWFCTEAEAKAAGFSQSTACALGTKRATPRP